MAVFALLVLLFAAGAYAERATLNPGDSSITIAITVNIMPTVASVEAAERFRSASQRRSLSERCVRLLGTSEQGWVTSGFRVSTAGHYDCASSGSSAAGPGSERAITVLIAAT